MSEATLKRKTRTQYRNMSVGQHNFSLTGTRRNQGYVGQTMLGRHFPRTPMRGNVARGHGGCCGTYLQTTIVQSGVPFPCGPSGNSANNNPDVIKMATLNTNGLIMTKYRWIRRPQPYSTVKIDATITNNTQSSYIKSKATNLINSLAACDQQPVCKNPYVRCVQKSRPFGSVIQYPRAWLPITKTAINCDKLKPISQSKFIETLHGACATKTEKVFTKTNRAPLPGPSASYR